MLWFIISNSLNTLYASSHRSFSRLKQRAHLAVAGWGGRSASQKAEHSSSGWRSRFVRSTYWLSLKCSSSSPSSKHCPRRETRRRGGTGIRGPWGSRWCPYHRRGQRKWRRSCSREADSVSLNDFKCIEVDTVAVKPSSPLMDLLNCSRPT